MDISHVSAIRRSAKIKSRTLSIISRADTIQGLKDHSAYCISNVCVYAVRVPTVISSLVRYYPWLAILDSPLSMEQILPNFSGGFRFQIDERGRLFVLEGKSVRYIFLSNIQEISSHPFNLDSEHPCAKLYFTMV